MLVLRSAQQSAPMWELSAQALARALEQQSAARNHPRLSATALAQGTEQLSALPLELRMALASGWSTALASGWSTALAWEPKSAQRLDMLSGC